jgi:hypothetical protein
VNPAKVQAFKRVHLEQSLLQILQRGDVFECDKEQYKLDKKLHINGALYLDVSKVAYGYSVEIREGDYIPRSNKI